MREEGFMSIVCGRGERFNGVLYEDPGLVLVWEGRWWD